MHCTLILKHQNTQIKKSVHSSLRRHHIKGITLVQPIVLYKYAYIVYIVIDTILYH